MDKEHQIYAPDMPMGLDIALAKNRNAMNYFHSLPEAAQEQIKEHTHSITNKHDMQAYVDSLVQPTMS